MKKPRINKMGWWVLALLAVAAGYLLITGPEGLFSIYRSYTELRAMKHDLLEQKQTADSLKVKIKRLESDTAYLEEIAREHLGMAKKSERVYKFIGGKK